MADPIFIHPYFLDFILPFVLVFTLIFAVLQKTQILGEGKKQIDAIIGLVVGLILIAFPYARGIIVDLMPFLAVSAVILLVFMLLYGFIAGGKGDVLNTGWKWSLITIAALALVTYLLKIMGYWDNVWDILFGPDSRFFWANGILFIAIVGAIVAVLVSKEKKGSSE
jgi:predicted neutral ceramidase superfamily lipid hydrolase